MACFTGEDAEPLTVGEIKVLKTTKLLLWHIPNVLSLTSSVDDGVDSPEFTFANATWCLQMYPHGQSVQKSENSVDLQVVRRKSLVDKHEGNVLLDMPTEVSFEDFDFIPEIESLKSDDPSEGVDFFIEPDKCAHSQTFMKYSSLVEDFVPPNDSVLVCCMLDTINNYDDLPQSVGSIVDKESSSIGNSVKNRTVGVTKDYDLKYTDWNIPKFSSLLRRSGIHSPRFFAADATWRLKISYSEKQETATVAIVRLHTPNPRSQTLFSEWEVIAEFPQGSKKLVATIYKADVKTNNYEYAMFSFRCCQHMTTSPITTLTVSCAMVRTETAVHHTQSEVVGSSSIASSRKLLQDFQRMLLTSEGSDVTLLVQGQEFEAHSNILKARSTVFNCMLNCDMKEKKTRTVDIEDCDPGTFKDFLRFLYCGSVEDMSSEKVFRLYRAADKYDVQDLKSLCVAFMRRNLTEDTFCDTLALSLQHGEKELLKLATEFFGKNYQRIILTVKWQEFITENPIQGNELFIKVLVLDSASNK